MHNTLITKETILLNLDAKSKADALHKMCGHLFLVKKTQNPSSLFADITARESVVSTFAGTKTAIPHAISAHVDEPVLCFARVQSDEFTWDGNDEDVRFIFLLSAPAKDDLSELRQSQSYVFSSVAELISRPETLELWEHADNESVILESLNHEFKAKLNNRITN
ncbi:PTS sugar transporter subunit IIA [Reinekea thalattae]|uniref:PTS sugar transporter subunit IIA n=1 Tax=Reinekea thalattae TaxID=2593301 RepID=A0A5C8Z8L9_9GAMM|nr:PTS sugar transporter subunit IIA [Reinekea thalattae]TXR54272.1 PTS sugar transporter subunit IIA [Reinekea thalattae]